MGRVALVTGGGHGIGEGSAQSPAGAGADVTTADFDCPRQDNSNAGDRTIATEPALVRLEAALLRAALLDD